MKIGELVKGSGGTVYTIRRISEDKEMVLGQVVESPHLSKGDFRWKMIASITKVETPKKEVVKVEKKIENKKPMLDMMFNVPLDDDGKKFVEFVKKYLNRVTYTLRVRGRHKNAKKAMASIGKTYDRDVSLSIADRVCLYIESPKKRNQYDDWRDETITELRERLSASEKRKDELTNVLRGLKNSMVGL